MDRMFGFFTTHAINQWTPLKESGWSWMMGVLFMSCLVPTASPMGHMYSETKWFQWRALHAHANRVPYFKTVALLLVTIRLMI